MSDIHELKKLLPVKTPLGEGYVLYVKDTGAYENDEWCVILSRTGQLRHFRTDQLIVLPNGTYDIVSPVIKLSIK